MRREETGTDRSAARIPGRVRSAIHGLDERFRALRAARLKVGGRALCAWGFIALVVCGLHLSLFGPEFRESWYAPLHFLWVVGGACGLSWWCLGPGRRPVRRWISLVEAVVFLAMSCGLSWLAASIPWGSGVVGESRITPAGGALIVASISLLVVPLVLVRAEVPGGVSRRSDPS